MGELLGEHRTRPETARESTGEEGFLLVAVIVMVFLVLLALSIAAPRIAMQIKRDREQETKARAEQYDRAIQLYYRKFKHYPNSIEELKKSNNQRFLRQEYVDPLTGQKDWRLIHVGENKTQVKGFFGEDLPGIGGASGLTGIGNSSGSGASSGGSAFNNGSSGSAFGSGSSGSAFGSGSGGFSTGSSFGAGSSTGSSSGTTGNSSGVASHDATTFGGSGGGPIMGVGVPKQGEALMTVNEQTNYQDWEFLYDPRIEQLRARASLMGGINSGSGTSPSGSTPIGASGAFNNGGNNGFGSGASNNGSSGNNGATTPQGIP